MTHAELPLNQYLKIYFKSEVRFPLYGKFVETEDDYIKKGFIRFVSESKMEKFLIKRDVSFSYLIRIAELSQIKISQYA